MGKGKYYYYAFISYSHKDASYARNLQRRLEHYRLDAKLSDTEKHITPVCIDRMDLVPDNGGLIESIRKKLDASRFLILVCSPDSAASFYVNAEVQYFLDCGRRTDIIPMILKGTPKAADPQLECFPPSLRALPPEEELLGISVKDYGKRGAFYRLVASLLSLPPDRIEARGRRERRIRAAIAAAAAAGGVTAGVFAYLYFTPQSRYYLEIAARYEVPEGLGKPLSKKEREGLDYFYRLTWQRGDVIQVERVDDTGKLKTPEILTPMIEPPSMAFSYATDLTSGKKHVSSVVCYDEHHMLLYKKQYSSDLSAVDFVSEGNGAYTLDSDQLSYSENDPSQIDAFEGSSIIRYVQTYDDQGRLLTRLFKRDNRGLSGGTPIQDANGVWGQQFDWNEQGEVSRVTFLDADGEMMTAANGSVAIEYFYNDAGRPTRTQYVDAQGEYAAGDGGTAVLLAEYDEKNRISRISFQNVQEEFCLNTDLGCYGLALSYDHHGNETRIDFLDADLLPAVNANGYMTAEFLFSEDQRTVRSRYLGADGQPVVLNGCVETVTLLDENGRNIHVSTYDELGNPVRNTVWNCCSVTSTYENDRLVRMEFLDEQGKPARNGEGISVIARYYDKNRYLIREDVLGTDQKLINSVNGYASCVYTYDSEGHISDIEHYDEDGKRTSNEEGVSRFHYVHENGVVTEISYFGTEDEPVCDSTYVHRKELIYDEFGRPVRENYYGTDGRRTFCNECYSAYIQDLDAYGRPVRVVYLDTEDHPCRNAKYAQAVTLYEYDAAGHITLETYQRTDVYDDPELACQAEAAYDEYGRLISTVWRNGYGEPVADSWGACRIDHFYDGQSREAGRVYYYNQTETPAEIEKNIYGENGQILETDILDGSENLTYALVYEYDETGSLISETVLNAQRQIDQSITGYASHFMEYDENGRVSREWYCDETGNRTEHTGKGFCERRIKRNRFGQIVEESYYDASGEKALISGEYRFRPASVHRICSTRDAYGQICREEFFGISEEPLGSTEYERMRSGEYARIKVYDEKGRLADTYYPVVLIEKVMEGSMGEMTGLRANDFLLKWDDWSYESIFEDPEKCIMDFRQMAWGSDEKEKTLTIGRFRKDGTIVQKTGTLPEGTVGITIYTILDTEDQIREYLFPDS